MQPFFPRFSRPFFLVYAALVLAVGCLLGACDRHSADDLPESYGHGSSHNKSYERHETDSRVGGHHFSDSKGLSPEKEHDKAAPGPIDKPDTTDAGRMFPSPAK